MVAYKCQSCGEQIENWDSDGGKIEKCPKCGQGNLVPVPEASNDEKGATIRKPVFPVVLSVISIIIAIGRSCTVFSIPRICREKE